MLNLYKLVTNSIKNVYKESRLALSALAITYGKEIEWPGPWYKSMEINGESFLQKGKNGTPGKQNTA